MKTNLNWRKKFLSVLSIGLLVGSVVFTSCSKDNEDNNNNGMYTVSGNSSGSQVSPSTTSTATGTLTGSYNANTNVMQYTINWNTLTAAASGVELRGPASTGANGVLVSGLTITTPGVTGTASGSVTLTESQEADLLAGKYYYTILTATNIAGEIRGQITATPQ